MFGGPTCQALSQIPHGFLGFQASCPPPARSSVSRAHVHLSPLCQPPAKSSVSYVHCAFRLLSAPCQVFCLLGSWAPCQPPKSTQHEEPRLCHALKNRISQPPSQGYNIPFHGFLGFQGLLSAPCQVFCPLGYVHCALSPLSAPCQHVHCALSSLSAPCQVFFLLGLRPLRPQPLSATLPGLLSPRLMSPLSAVWAPEYAT